ncbi:MAG TPA: hypothetical protein VN688_15320 [Gemmataceae bacterium]|nr:hypothetical protein [Gemmataceae bacterium]
MTATPSAFPRKTIFFLFCVLVLSFPVTVNADAKPLSKAEQAKVDTAIDRAVQFLKETQTDEGDWGGKMYKDGRFSAGQCALPAYALLESGMPANDPLIRKAAEFLRPRASTTDFTYEIALAILFFDRLNDPKDKRLIQTLALRLIAGQHQTGGWSYRCPILFEKNEQELSKALDRLSKQMKGKARTRDRALQDFAVPAAFHSLTVFQRAEVLPWREPPASNAAWDEAVKRVSLAGMTDNSNTQLALLGLWVAQRQGIAPEPTFAILVERFERSQGYPSGLWGYAFDKEAGSRSMICVGLMGLAIGRGLKLPTSGAAVGAEKDVHVLRGLSALRRHIGQPTGEISKRVPLYDGYFLWSLERVAMLYNLPTIGEKDWYRWGMESVVANQAKDGSWTGRSPYPEWKGNRNYDYKATMSTAFALLFLKRSHPMKELTPKLPFTAKELNAGIARLRPSDKYPLRPATASSPSRKLDP